MFGQTSRFWMILSATILCVGCGEGPEQLLPESTSRPIVGGQAYSGMPAVGALIYEGKMYCTGTVIAPRKVVTAAHCLDEVVPSEFTFVLGANAFSPEKVLKVASGKQHPNWDGQGNDIALITLAQDAPVTPMEVLKKMDDTFIGKSLFFVGYGVNNGLNQTGEGSKRAVSIPVTKVDPTSFAYAGAGKNTCNGDSGGPAFYQDASGKYLVAGVTSYGDVYCSKFGVDTRVDAFISFLGVSGNATVTAPVNNQAPAVDPCQGETYEGRCDGNTVVWCEDDKVQKSSCTSKGKTCGLSSTKGYYVCK